MVAVYPLHWPAEKPRTKDPRTAPFGSPGEKAFAHLEAQVRLRGGKLLQVSSNYPVYVATLTPKWNDRAPADTGVAVYFTLDGIDVCFACDQWNRVEDNMRGIGKTIEALRGIARWGSADMERAAFRGYAALPGPVAAPAGPPWSDVLGVEPGASRADIDAAYRALLKQHHPDMPDGDREMFHRVQVAYQAATALS